MRHRKPTARAPSRRTVRVSGFARVRLYVVLALGVTLCACGGRVTSSSSSPPAETDGGMEATTGPVDAGVDAASCTQDQPCIVTLAPAPPRVEPGACFSVPFRGRAVVDLLRRPTGRLGFPCLRIVAAGRARGFAGRLDEASVLDNDPENK